MLWIRYQFCSFVASSLSCWLPLGDWQTFMWVAQTHPEHQEADSRWPMRGTLPQVNSRKQQETICSDILQLPAVKQRRMETLRHHTTLPPEQFPANIADLLQKNKNDLVKHFQRRPDHWSCLACKRGFTTFKDFYRHIVRRRCNQWNGENEQLAGTKINDSVLQ